MDLRFLNENMPSSGRRGDAAGAALSSSNERGCRRRRDDAPGIEEGDDDDDGGIGWSSNLVDSGEDDEKENAFSGAARISGTTTAIQECQEAAPAVSIVVLLIRPA